MIYIIDLFSWLYCVFCSFSLLLALVCIFSWACFSCVSGSFFCPHASHSLTCFSLSFPRCSLFMSVQTVRVCVNCLRVVLPTAIHALLLHLPKCINYVSFADMSPFTFINLFSVFYLRVLCVFYPRFSSPNRTW